MSFPMPVSGSGEPVEGVNWEAYTHEELHRMLWDQADVDEVTAIASEWHRHSTELAEQAARLRDQQTALREHWQGESAELAATRLGELAERVEGISARASANQQAAQRAAEALALARTMLPPPPGATPAAPFAAPPAPTAPFAVPSAPAPSTTTPFAAAPEPFTLPSAPEPFTPPSAPAAFTPQAAPVSPFTLPSAPEPIALPSAPAPTQPSSGGFYMLFGAPAVAPTGTGMAPAFGSVATSGSSMYFNDFAANQAKAQAVQAMRVYESNLRGGEALVSVPGDVGSRTYGVAGSGQPTALRGGSGAVADPRSGGVPWQRLVGPGVGQPQDVPGRGPSVGARLTAATPAFGGAIGAPDHAAGRTTGAAGGMAPPVGQRGGSSDDEVHENRMPVLDHGLFAVNDRISAPVIGAGTPGGDQ